MNPIAALEKELEALYKRYELVRFCTGGQGTTTWSMLNEQEKKAYSRAVDIRHEIRQLRKYAGLRHKTSSVAHGSRR